MVNGINITLQVNGRIHEIDVQPNDVLLHTLRDLGYTDVKNGCEIGECGACAVLLNGQPVNSCMVLASQADRAEIVTNAGLGTIDKPHIIQEAFADAGAVQCGFCTPGMVISTKALLDRNPDPTETEIRDALSGNLCRCTGYGQIIEAVRMAADRLRDLPSWAATSQCEVVGERLGVLQSDEQASSFREEGREHDSSNRVLESDVNAHEDDRAKGGAS